MPFTSTKQTDIKEQLGFRLYAYTQDPLSLSFHFYSSQPQILPGTQHQLQIFHGNTRLYNREEEFQELLIRKFHWKKKKLVKLKGFLHACGFHNSYYQTNQHHQKLTVKCKTMDYQRISKLEDPQQSSRLTSLLHPAKLNDLSGVTKAGQQNGSLTLKKKLSQCS